MTLSVREVHSSSPNLIIQSNTHNSVRILDQYIEVEITEDFHHLRHFWSDLGKLLNRKEEEERIRLNQEIEDTLA